MSLYDTMELQKRVDSIAEANEGEIPEELLQMLIQAEMSSLVQIEGICKYIRHLELEVIKACKAEEDRIAVMRKKAENRVESIKKYMVPYIQQYGKIEAGTFQLSVRKSIQTKTTDEFKNAEYCDIVTTVKPRKADIKKAIDEGKKIDGAWLEEKDNLQIK